MRKRMTVLIVLLGVSVVGARSAWPGSTQIRAVEPAARKAAVRFTQRPNVTKAGRNVRIEFAVNVKTDVAVYVEGAKGRVVRHLAAGVLGDRAPKPLVPGTLAQSLVWDRTDDLGRPVPPGKYTVRIAAGLQAGGAGTAFTKETGPANLTGSVMGLAAGPDGRVYVLTQRWHSGHWNATTVHVFLRNGNYERTIKPFPANLPPSKLKGVGAIDDHGRAVPVVHRAVAMSFYPWEDVAHHMTVTPDGKLQMIGVGVGYRKKPLQYLVAIDAKTGAPYEGFPGTPLVGRAGIRDVYLAPAHGGEAVYFTGLEAYDAGFHNRQANPPVVYRVDLAKRGPAVPFVGDVKIPGSDKKHLNDPRGVATDGRGNLYIADRGNNRVLVVHEKGGTFVGSIAVPSPTWVGVSARHRAAYVAGGGSVIKFSVGEHPKEVARLALPAVTGRDRGRVRWSFALDGGAEKPVLWVGRSRGGTALMRAVDEGRTFGPLRQAGYHPARRLWNVSVGLRRREIACKVGWKTLRILDEGTGTTRDLHLPGSGGQTYRLGPNGQVYGMDHWKWGVRRWDRNGRPLPFPATKDLAGGGRGRTRSAPSGTTSWERDFSVDHAGNVYAKHRGKHYHGRMTVNRYDKDGNFKRTVLWAVSDGAMGPRVDRQGNLYIAEAVKPIRRRHPAFFKDRMPTVQASRQYTWMVGSIVKFGPKGGAVWFPVIRKYDEYAFDGSATLDASLAREEISTLHSGRLLRTPGYLQGALWWRFGCAPVLDMHRSHNVRCHCTGSDFDVDDFGRVFYPDQGRFRIVVCDTNGNTITAFGRYGNQDSCGPGSYVQQGRTGMFRPRRTDDPPDAKSPFAEPEIALTWIVGLGVSDRCAYIADALNRRVLRVKLSYECDARVAVP